MDVVSPTSVAAPCRLLDTAMAMITGTGLVLICFATARPTGATISTVATLSTKAEMRPENRLSATMAQRTSGTSLSSPSAMRCGMPLWINSSTIAIVPASIIRTFQLIAPIAAPTGSMPSTTNTSAATSAMIQRASENFSSSTYMTANRISASTI